MSRRTSTRWAAVLGLGLVVGAVAVPAQSAPTWLRPATPLSAVDGTSFDPTVVVDARGNATAVWTRFVGSPSSHYVVESASRPLGGAWSPPVQVSPASDEAITSDQAD